MSAAKVNYKMSKLAKIMLSRILDPHERGRVRRLIVAAEKHVLVTPKRNPLEKDKNNKQNKNSNNSTEVK
jgi:hypothetical protein